MTGIDDLQLFNVDTEFLCPFWIERLGRDPHAFQLGGDLLFARDNQARQYRFATAGLTEYFRHSVRRNAAVQDRVERSNSSRDSIDFHRIFACGKDGYCNQLQIRSGSISLHVSREVSLGTMAGHQLC
jgi:hypothetical protein